MEIRDVYSRVQMALSPDYRRFSSFLVNSVPMFFFSFLNFHDIYHILIVLVSNL